MAITTALCTSFRREVLQALHDFTAGTGHTFKLALYTSAATLDADTETYSSTNEASGTGYTPGGAILTSITPESDGVVACVDFNDLTIPAVTITARGCEIYNFSSGNRATACFDFGSDKTSSGGDFILAMPDPTATDAIIRI